MAGEILVQESVTDFHRYGKLSVITPASGGLPALVIPNRKNGLMSSFEMQAVVDTLLPENSALSNTTIREGRNPSTEITTLPSYRNFNLYWMRVGHYLEEFLCGPGETPSQALRYEQSLKCKERVFEMYKENRSRVGWSSYAYASYPPAWAFYKGKGLVSSSVFAWGQYFRYREGFSIYETTNVGKFGGIWGYIEVDSGFLNPTGASAVNPRIMLLPGIAAGTLVECWVTFPAITVRIVPTPRYPPGSWTPSIHAREVLSTLTGKFPDVNSVVFGEYVSCGIADSQQYQFYKKAENEWYSGRFTARVQFRVPESRMVAFFVTPRDLTTFWGQYAVSELDDNGNYCLSDLEIRFGSSASTERPQPQVSFNRICQEYKET